MASRGLLTCIFVYFVIEAKYVFVSGQFTLETSSSVAVVGTDFTLTCTLSQNTSVPTFISWTKGAVSNFINPSPCTVAGTNKWPSYAYTCNNKVFTLTIPGDDIDPENDNNVQWTCGNGGGTNSNPLTMTVLTLSDLKMRGLDEDKELRHESDVVTITIKTGCVYPAAFIKIIFVDKDDTSKEYYEITQNATENAVATASANCSNPAKVYEVELRITRELVETDRPVKVKAALTFASVSQTFSSKTSNFTITECWMGWIFLSFVFFGLFLGCAGVVLILCKTKNPMVEVYTPEGLIARKVWWYLVHVGISSLAILCLVLTIGLYFVVCQKTIAIRDGVLIGILPMTSATILLLVHNCRRLHPGGNGKGENVGKKVNEGGEKGGENVGKKVNEGGEKGGENVGKKVNEGGEKGGENVGKKVNEGGEKGGGGIFSYVYKHRSNKVSDSNGDLQHPTSPNPLIVVDGTKTILPKIRATVTEKQKKQEITTSSREEITSRQHVVVTVSVEETVSQHTPRIKKIKNEQTNNEETKKKKKKKNKTPKEESPNLPFPEASMEISSKPKSRPLPPISRPE